MWPGWWQELDPTAEEENTRTVEEEEARKYQFLPSTGEEWQEHNKSHHFGEEFMKSTPEFFRACIYMFREAECFPPEIKKTISKRKIWNV